MKEEYMINTVTSAERREITVGVHLNGKLVDMVVDTGADVSILSQKEWQEIGKPPLSKTHCMLRAYSGSEIPVLGQTEVQIEYGSQKKHLPVIVVPQGRPLMGKPWLQKIQLDWTAIFKVTARTSATLDKLLQEYREVFEAGAGVGGLKDIKVHLKMIENAQPRFYKSRPVPYSMRTAIEDELARLEAEGVIEKVSSSDWAAPLVPVLKDDGKIRLCGDYKVTVNPQLKVDQHPIPNAEDLYNSMNGGQHFSKLDLSQAFLQFELDENSRHLTTVNTHRGLYQFRRLPFGISSAPALCQETLDKILHGIPYACGRIDDILVSGKDEHDHLVNLRAVFERLRKFNVKLKKTKCTFLQPELVYLGFIIDAKGIRKNPERLKAVLDLPAPQNVSELRAMLGMVAYYQRFVPCLSAMASPLHALLKNGQQWRWDKVQREAFRKIKQELAKETLLVHYDRQLPLLLAVDASSHGLGAVISHVVDDIERPIAYASRSLTKAECGYSQLDKEALAIIFGLNRFYNYVYGRKFTIYTDHKPLVRLLGPKEKLPSVAAARLQRWALQLAAFNYDLKFKRTEENGNADCLSRLPRSGGQGERDQEAQLFNLRQIEAVPVSASEIRKSMARDTQLSAVFRYTKEGWPSEYNPVLRPYFARREELTIEDGILLWGQRVVVPAAKRAEVLNELHGSHPGGGLMKAIARQHVWWPGLDQEIEEVAKGCDACQQAKGQERRVPLLPWSWPERPGDRVHIDFASYSGKEYLLITDAHSKWLEIVRMQNITAASTILVLRRLFASWGLPKQIVSDNGPTFTSTMFAEFLVANGIRHIKVTPYHPRANGEVERTVRTFKESMRSMAQNGASLEQNLLAFLLRQRTTPHSTTGRTPADLFMGRSLRTRLDLIHPDVRARVDQQQARNKEQYDRSTVIQNLGKGSPVWVRDYRDHSRKWQPGVVAVGAGSSFKVQVGDQVWRRHGEQLRPRDPTSSGVVLPKVTSLADFPNPQADTPADLPAAATGQGRTLPKSPACMVPESSVSTPVRRSSRVFTRPQRLTYVGRGKPAEDGKV